VSLFVREEVGDDAHPTASADPHERGEVISCRAEPGPVRGVSAEPDRREEGAFVAPRDVVSRSMYQEIKEGRGAGPDGDYVYLDISHLDPAVIEEKLPDITEFARVYLRVEPTREREIVDSLVQGFPPRRREPEASSRRLTSCSFQT